MKIKKLELKNFRQFKNIEIEFSNDPNKPFTIITGGNTFGKTTFVNAFLWCLYGEKNFKDKLLLNKILADKLPIGKTEEVYARLELEHDGWLYRIVNREEYKKTNELRIVKTSNDRFIHKSKGENTISINDERDITKEIEKILSNELAPYFFFDGENNSIENITTQSNLKDSVSKLMKIKKTELFVEYFNKDNSSSVIRVLESKKESSDMILSAELQDKLEAELKEKANELEKLKNCESEINNLENQANDKEEILNKNHIIYELQGEKKGILDTMKSINEQKNSSIDIMFREVRKKDLLNSLFAYSYKSNDLKNINSYNTFSTDKNISSITEEAIDLLISRGYCLCGTKIESYNDAYNHLISQKELLEHKNYDTEISYFIDQENNNYNNCLDYMNDLINMAVTVNNKISELDRKIERYNEIVNDIKGKDDVGRIQEDINKIREQIGQCKAKKDNLEKNIIPNCDVKIAEIEKNIKVNEKTSQKNAFIDECIKYAEYIRDFAKKSFDEKQEQTRKDLESTVQTIFDEMYEGQRKIIIDDGFNVKNTLTDSSDLDSSTGLKTVMNFSFVAGLIKLIKDKNKKSNIVNDFFEPEITDENYPLVMDAPFSSTDEKHIANICLNLPKYCNQIIIFIMEKDYNTASSKIMEKIGKKYVLEKKSETLAEIREEF